MDKKAILSKVKLFCSKSYFYLRNSSCPLTLRGFWVVLTPHRVSSWVAMKLMVSFFLPWLQRLVL